MIMLMVMKMIMIVIERAVVWGLALGGGTAIGSSQKALGQSALPEDVRLPADSNVQEEEGDKDGLGGCEGGGLRDCQGGSQDKKAVASGDAALLLKLSARVEALEAIPPSSISRCMRS